MLESEGPSFAPACFIYSEKQDGLVFLAFLELLEKVVFALTCHLRFRFSHGII